MKIDIAKDFSHKPFGRDDDDGKFNGRRFRQELLMRAFNDNNEPVEVFLDGVTRGFGSSFLDEAFAGLIRDGVDYNQVKTRLVIRTDDDDYKSEIWDYIEEEHQREGL